MSSLQIIYASTSGHTEYVVDTLAVMLKKRNISVKKIRAETAKKEDLLSGDVLILASSTWNTGNVEGQLNPHMYALLTDHAKDLALAGKKVALIALGDERYRYRANAAVHMEEFVNSHGGALAVPALKILNEPYGQESAIEEWGKKLLSALQ